MPSESSNQERCSGRANSTNLAWELQLLAGLSRSGGVEAGATASKETSTTTASDLLQRHIQTLVADNAQWQTFLADDLVWELPYVPSIGDPARLAGRQEVMRHVTWFLGAVENVRFFDLQVNPFADPEAAVAEVHQSTKRIYRQEYIVFLRAANGKIAFLREYFDPTRAAKAMDKPILGLDS